MKSANRKLTAERQKFNSDEELYFSWLLRDLKKGGWIVGAQYEPSPWVLTERLDLPYHRQLKTKRKQEKAFMWSGHKYTCDFKIVWKPEAESCLFWKPGGSYRKLPPFVAQDIDGRPTTFIEVKPAFDFNNMTREVRVKVAMVYRLYGHVVQIVKVPSAFKNIFTPHRFIWTDTGKQLRKIGGRRVTENKDFRTLEQLVNQMGGKQKELL
jgi:hypothetical protein